ncbi:MAG: hypothetical protein GQ558_09365 [Thermoplasmata archaeon]|nr:hypothetical protein [Thermoplasmata archaeon]
MGEAELAVLVMTLLVGLLIGLLVPWTSLLTSTGHPERSVAREAGRGPPPGRRPEAHTGRVIAGSFLAVIGASLLIALMLPDIVDGVPLLDDLPVSTFVLAFAALLVSVGYAMPTWVGVRR